MRHHGRIIKWKDEQGFGFIAPKGGGDEVFVHAKAFANRQRRPKVAEMVSYEFATDAKGRKRAESVAFINDEQVTAIRGQEKGLAVPALFFMILIASAVTGRLPFPILGLYAVVSTVTFLAYQRDKSAAETNKRRTPEDVLHLFSLLGGWPGALVAQEMLRHKSRKQSFRIVFWITVGLNCVGLAWLFSPTGSDALRSIIGPF